MWGLNRFNRPPAVTGILIPCAFLCGIAAAVLIWQCGERTKKRAEVSRRVWHMLKKDEEELVRRQKEAAELRVAAKRARKERASHATGLTAILSRPSREQSRVELEGARE